MIATSSRSPPTKTPADQPDLVVHLRPVGVDHDRTQACQLGGEPERFGQLAAMDGAVVDNGEMLRPPPPRQDRADGLRLAVGARRQPPHRPAAARAAIGQAAGAHAGRDDGDARLGEGGHRRLDRLRAEEADDEGDICRDQLARRRAAAFGCAVLAGDD
jgi:hypothetical protein